MIHCGWCKIALEEFNKDDFNFVENKRWFKPFLPDMEKYLEKFKFPFPVITEAKEIGKPHSQMKILKY